MTALTAVRRPSGLMVVALLMPVGPAAVALLRYLLPYYTADTAAAQAAAAAAEPGRESAVLWLGYIAVLTLVPGVIGLARVTRTASPRLTAWAVALVVPAYLSLGGLMSGDQMLWSGQEAGLDTATTATLLENPHPTVNIAIGVFVVGHVLGTVLLGVALLRSGRVPAWAAWGLVVSQPLHFVATVILGSPELDLLAWSLTALGMAMAAAVLVRERRDMPSTWGEQRATVSR